jgi:glycosyltransferase involved in cell wall biosynthesis
MLHQPLPEPISKPPISRILIISDAWLPQVNGVVRTLSMMVEQLRLKGLAVTVIGPDQFRNAPCPTYPEIRLALFPGRRLARLIDDYAPDALHIATEGPLGWAARAYAKKRGLAFTSAYHTRFPEYLYARTKVPIGISYAVLRHFHGAGSGIMVATKSLYDDLATRGFKNIRMWGRGVDLAQFSPAPAEQWPLARPIFAYVGRIAVEKNLRAFLDLDLPGSKLLVGDGPQRSKLEREYPHVHFAGARHGASLAAAYAGADVFVFPSRTDTFGLVLLEALACGVPIAAFPVMGPRDIVATAHEPIGALNEDLRQAALDAMTADRDACRRHAETYSWTACADKFLSNLVPMTSGAAHIHPLIPAGA